MKPEDHTAAPGLNLQIRQHEGLARTEADLQGWLDADPEFAGRRPHISSLRYIDGAGSSNETAAARLDLDGQVTEVVVRLVRSELGGYLDGRLDRQIALMNWMAEHTDVPVARIVAADPQDVAIGRAFMIMERIHGVSAPDFPGYNVEGWIYDMPEASRRRLWEGALDMLCRLHRVDARRIDFLDFPGRPRAELEDLLAHWRNSYEWAAEDARSEFFDSVLAWLEAHRPTTAPKGLSWGDARIANMLFRGEDCVAVLDWEMASCGGPLVDLAWWLLFDRIQDEDIGVARLPGLGNREETIARWSQKTGLPADDLAWHEVLAHFQLAITRARAFGKRQRRGQPVPGPEDPRSVLRLQRRLERMLDL